MPAAKFLIPVLLASGCLAAEIILPSTALERDRPVNAIYRTNGQATGKGELSIEWTDVHGRVVDSRKLPVELTDETDIGFTLDLRRAAAMTNELRVHFTFDGVNKKGAKDHRDENAKVSFVARPPDRTWWDYQIIMWEDYSADQFAVLKTLGINGGQYSGRATAPPDFLLKNDLRWYAENIATDFYSEYHRWRPDRIQNWSLLQAKELYKKDPSSKEAFKRHPSFSDPEWRRRIHDRLVESARRNAPYRPVFYSLADESGIADLASFWDFDFSDQSLAGMREWLKQRYGTLAALNRQWDTNFSTWDAVTPDTTNEAMKRAGDNFSSWADFKEWMDISYADALKMGADAVRSVDPEAYVAIGGGQMPGWGGYDYYRLTQALTAIEPYDIGNNIEIIRSINPRMPFVTTAFARGPWEKHRIWYELLHGAHGQLIWDDKSENVTKDGQVGERGREVAPYYNELRNGVASLLMNSVRQSGPVAIHYSQASMRTEWMLAQRPKGAAWVERGSAIERMDSDFLRLRESFCRLIEDLGMQYNFVAYGQVEDGELLKRGYRVLILPRSSALSAREAQAIREFAAQGGVVVAEGEPGVFDEHSRRLPQSSLAGVNVIRLKLDALNYQQARLIGKEGELHRYMGKVLADAGVRPAFAVVDDAKQPVVGVETHEFRNGGVSIVGLLSNPSLRVNELGPPEFQKNDRFAKPRTVRLVLPGELYAYEIRTGNALGRKTELQITLDPYEPTLFAFSPSPLPALTVAAPRKAAAGETARIGLSFAAPTPASKHLFHIDVIDPTGKTVDYYSGNLLAPEGHAEKQVPFATNDKPGTWTVRVRDLLSGQEKTTSIEVAL
ncbi:MAG: beta-galactosidase [Acidobacteriota bacterium]